MRHEYSKFVAGEWQGFAAAEGGGTGLTQGDPLALTQTPDAVVVRDRPSARTHRVTVNGGIFYIKHLLAWSDAHVGKAGLGIRLKRKLLGPRVLATLRLSVELAGAGIDSPPVMLVAWRRHLGRDEELLITQSVEGDTATTVLADPVHAPRIPMLLELIGRSLARLHDAGFVHGDCVPGNVLLRPENNGVVWLDNDRTRRLRFRPAASAQQRNLVQMCYRLMIFRETGLAEPLLKAYCAQRGWSASVAERYCKTVLAAAGQRLAAFAREFPDFRERGVITATPGSLRRSLSR